MDGGGDFWKENLFAVESSLLKSECRQLIVKMLNNIMIFTKKFWVNLSWKITQSKYVRNMDESGISLDSHPLKLAAWKGQKKVRYTSSVRKNQITIVACGSATGQSIPPLVIFDVKHLSPLWMRYEVEGMALVKKAGLIASCCMGGWWNISWSMLLRHAHSSSSLMGIASLWTSNNYICKRERYHHFVSPSTHNSWNSATRLQLVWIPQIHWLFMTFIRRILEVISKLNSPGYFDRHGCNQLQQRIQKARDCPFNRNAILLFHSELLDKQLPLSTSTLAGTSSTVSALPPLRIYTFQKCYVTHNLGKFFQEAGRLLQTKIQQRVWFDGSRILAMIGNLSPWGNTRWQVLSSNSTPKQSLPSF